eukprot:gene11162-12162_t
MGFHLVAFIQSQSDFLLNVAPTLVWCLLFVLIMDREKLFETWFMPFLGVFAAFLANSVPLGGGIVYIPALSLLGANITLGAAFTLSVMPIGNGFFGFIRWILKDPTVILWESFQYTVLPSWVGSLIAMFLLPKVDHYWIKMGFGWFCFLIGLLVLAGVYKNGIRNVFFSASSGYKTPHATEHTSKSGDESEKALPTFDDLIHDEEDDGHFTDDSDSSAAGLLSRESHKKSAQSDSFAEALQKWAHVIVISFLGGIVLVPNIAIGPALITYILLAMMGYRDQQALVTGIVTGGWVCVLPFLIHIFILKDVPWELWIMVLPGVFYGAKYAPYLIDRIGVQNVMVMFSLFLFASALLYWFH